MIRTTRTRTALPALIAAAAIALAGCAPATDQGASSAPPSPSGPELSGTLTIYAAASLKTAFEELASEFEAAHPGLDVLPIVADGSSTLATQLTGGAPADVFASADEKNMQKVVDAGLAASPVVFATNTLVIATPKGNPAGIATLEDLAKPDTTLVICAPEVPCGAASQTLLGNAGVTVSPASLEQNVTAVLTKVRAGEADAGLVYATDVASASDVDVIVPAGASKVVNRYPIAALTDAANPDAAAAFAAFVAGPSGKAVLAKLGFGTP